MAKNRYLTDVVTLKLDAQKCNGCGLCQVVCPRGVFDIVDHKAVIVDRDACIECGACSRNCPTNAIEVQSGVGCAAAIIAGALMGTEPTCDCTCSSKEDKPKKSCCG